MENKAMKKAKKGLFSIVFGRTALVFLFILIQLLVLVGVATILNDYAVYVYSGLTVLAAVIVIYIINEQDILERGCAGSGLIQQNICSRNRM